jgi:integrase
VSEALVPTEVNTVALAILSERAKDFGRNAKASETRRGYKNDLKSFEAFCKQHGVTMLPATPQTVANYLAHLSATKRMATIRRHMVSIAQAHKLARHPNPVADPYVREIAQGIARTLGTAPKRKDALAGQSLRDALAMIDAETLKGKRDRAIILLGFACAARRSELAALNVEDLRFEKRGIVVTIRRSKTDQTGEGREIGVPLVPNEDLCAVRAVKAWMESAAITEGVLFRTFDGGKNLTANRIDPGDVARLVKRVTGEAGIDGDFAAHSLRAGFITEAASTKGVSEVNIQRISGHHSVAILRGYVRRADVFDDAPLSAMLK